MYAKLARKILDLTMRVTRHLAVFLVDRNSEIRNLSFILKFDGELSPGDNFLRGLCQTHNISALQSLSTFCRQLWKPQMLHKKIQTLTLERN